MIITLHEIFTSVTPDMDNFRNGAILIECGIRSQFELKTLSTYETNLDNMQNRRVLRIAAVCYAGNKNYDAKSAFDFWLWITKDKTVKMKTCCLFFQRRHSAFRTIRGGVFWGLWCFEIFTQLLLLGYQWML